MIAWALGLILLITPPTLGDERAGDDWIPLGGGIECSLRPDDHPLPALGAARIFRVDPGAGGTLTLCADSSDGDVIIVRLGADGAALATDDDGGIGTNARLVLDDVDPKQALRVLVGFKAAREGLLKVSAASGRVDLPTGAELILQTGRWKIARGKARLARGDEKGACDDLIRGASPLFDLQRYDEVVDALMLAEPLLEQHAQAVYTAYTHGFLASSLFRLERLDEARPRLEASVAEARTAELLPVEMLAVSDLGKLQAMHGELSEAEDMLSHALALAQQLKDRANELVLHTELARLFITQGRLAEGRASCEAAEALAVETSSQDLQADVLATRAKWYLASWDLRAAEAALERALLLSTKPRTRANQFGQLGDLRWAMADPRGAAHAYWQAAEIAVELDDAALLARAEVGMGRAHLALDEPLAAREAFDAGLEHLDLNANRAVCLMYRSTALALLGEHEAALASAAEAREIADAMGDARLISNTITELARQHYVLGDYAACEELARERLAVLADTDFPIDAARARADLAEACFRQGRVDEADQEASTALEELKDLGLEQERVALEVACVLTQVALSREDLADAEQRMRHLLGIAGQLHQKANDVQTVSAMRAGGTLSTVAQMAHDLTALRVRRATDPVARQAALDEGLRQAGEWKGMELAAGLQTVRRAGADFEASRLLQERRRLLAERDAVVTELLAGVVRDRPAEELEELSAMARDLDSEALQIASRLGEHSASDASLEGVGSWGLDELRASLRPGELYIEFVEGLTHLYSFVVSDEGAAMHDLGPLEERRAQVNEFVAGLSDREQLADAPTVARTGLELWDALMEPGMGPGSGTGTAGLFAGHSTLVIIPSGSLASLPFEALVLAAERRPRSFEDLEFLIDRQEVVYASSGPVFAALQASSPRTAPGRALVLGDPVYEIPSTSTLRGSRDPRQLGFTRLPGTRDEALGLAEVLLDTTGAAADDGVRSELDRRKSDRAAEEVLDLPSLRLMLGSAVTPEALQGDLREFGLIHCATHGHMDVHDPGLTGLALSPSETDDGFVTASDVLELSLDADLAVLSACETARGRQRRGEGTLSLSRAFLYAGARSVVSSMWQVDDRETERTMEVFYDGILREGQTVSQSLREARLALRHGKAAPDAFRGVGRGSLLGGSSRKTGGRSELAGHPYFWAPFVYVGPTELRLRTGEMGAVGR